MKTYNRFLALSKRILHHKAYILMLLCIIALTITYTMLPDKSKTTDIRVAIYYEEQNKYTDELSNEIDNMNSIYTFFYTDSKAELINIVKSGNAECGFFFPTGFFEDYVRGNVEKNPIEIYTIPSTSLSATICESIFSNIIKITAEEILIRTVNTPELNNEMSEKLYKYRNGDKIFTLSSSVSGEFSFEDMSYKIKLPIHEIIVLFLIISSLLGLLLFECDQEKNMYNSIRSKELLLIRILAVTSAVIPLYIAGTISVLVMYGFGQRLISCALTASISIISAVLLGFIVKKSSLLSKLIPLITFIATICIFLTGLIG